MLGQYNGKIKALLILAMVVLALTLVGCGKKSLVTGEKAESEKEEKMEQVVEVEENHNTPSETDNQKTGPVFKSHRIRKNDAVYNRIVGHSYPENAKVALSELRYLEITYYGFDEEEHIGEMIVHKDVAKDILEIFQILYEEDYPIERMQLVDDFDADDEKSMEANNTSAFNYRMIANSNRLSNHSYGKAIDVNPRYNPYVYTYEGKLHVEPANGVEYADRNRYFPHKIDGEDLCCRLFKEHGFIWGGDFRNRKDYQHFEKTEE